MTEFWNQRTKRYGHTGWSDQAIYFYDQKIRLNTIASVLDELDISGTALDYGCGIGDFSNLLGQKFEKVIATDSSDEVLKRARKKYTKPNISFVDFPKFCLNTELGLILEITVFQHILNDEDLVALLREFHKNLKPASYMLVLDSFSDNDRVNNYTHLRKSAHFIKTVEDVGFQTVSIRNFYHPDYVPTPEFNRYRNKFITKIANRLTHYKVLMAKSFLKYWAGIHARDHKGLIEESSPTQLIIFRKK